MIQRTKNCMGMRAAMTLLALFCCLIGARAEEVTVGDLSSEDTYSHSGLPMESSSSFSYSQQIYTASEIGRTGTINSITLWLTGSANLPEMEFNIYMKEVDKERFDSETDWVPMTDGDMVFSGKRTFHNTDAEAVTFVLDQPFNYSGLHNLLIAFNNVTNSGGYGLEGMAFPANDGVPRAILTHQVYTSLDLTNPTFEAFTTIHVRNVMTLDITENPPTDLTCIAMTATTATLSWTKVGPATQWHVWFVSDDGITNSVTTADDNLFTLTGLTEDMRYTVRVRASNGDAWSEPIVVEPTWKTVIGSGEETSTTLPTYAYDEYSLTQQIFTKEELGGAGNILSIDFYKTGTMTIPRQLDIYMVCTDRSSFGGRGDGRVSVSRSDLVFSGNVSFAPEAWTTITLDAPFEYDGQSNVVIVVDDNTNDSYGYSFRAFSAQAQAFYSHSNSNIDPTNLWSYSADTSNRKNQVRLGKVELPAVLKPKHFTVSDIAPKSAKLNWTSDATSFNVRWGTDARLTQWLGYSSNVDNPYTLTGLLPEITYYVQVQACDPQKGNSAWATTSFTTIPLNTAPQSLEITDMTRTSAKLGWTGYQDSYTVRLTEPERPKENAFTEISSVPSVTTQLTEYTFNFFNYSGTGTVAIRGYKGIDRALLYLDDFTLTDHDGKVLWTQDFESGEMPEGWKQMKATGASYAWSVRKESINTSYCHGKGYLYSDKWDGDDNWLIIPNVELGGKLTLWAKAERYGDSQADLAVFVSTADEVTFPELVTEMTDVQSPCPFTGLKPTIRYLAQVMGFGQLVGNTEWSSLYFTIPDHVRGDVNGDFKVTPADAIMILYRYFGVEQEGFIEASADLNGDKQITPADAIEALYTYFSGFGDYSSIKNLSRTTRPAPAADSEAD